MSPVFPTCSASAITAFRSRLRASQLHAYRFLDGSEVPWENSPAGKDESLRRFLVARKGDHEKASELLSAHLLWRRQVFPVDRTGPIAQIFQDGRRLRKIGTASDGRPVLMIDFCWGYFVEGGFSELDCLRATIIFVEEEIALAEKDDQHEAYVLCYGGPPPLAFAAALAATLEANYPERLLRAVIYPVPQAVARFVRLMLWFLDERTSSKVVIEWSEEKVVNMIKLSVDQLPAAIQGGRPTAERQFKPDSVARMRTLIRQGIQGGGAPAKLLLQQLLRPLPDSATSFPAAEANSSLSPVCLCCCAARERELDWDEPQHTRPMKQFPSPSVPPSADAGVVSKMPGFSRHAIVAFVVILLALLLHLQQV